MRWGLNKPPQTHRITVHVTSISVMSAPFILYKRNICRLVQVCCVSNLNTVSWWHVFPKWWTSLGIVPNKTKYNPSLIYIQGSCNLCKFSISEDVQEILCVSLKRIWALRLGHYTQGFLTYKMSWWDIWKTCRMQKILCSPRLFSPACLAPVSQMPLRSWNTPQITRSGLSPAENCWCTAGPQDSWSPLAVALCRFLTRLGGTRHHWQVPLGVLELFCSKHFPDGRPLASGDPVVCSGGF